MMDKITDELPAGPRLNVGCGPVQPAGWVNVDGSNRALLASKFNWLDTLLVKCGILPPTEFNRRTKYHNLYRGLPYPDNTIAAIYAGELWEHFECADAEELTRECYRVLQPRGVLRVCVPDGPTYWGRYLQIHQEELARPRRERNVQRLCDYVQLYFNEICTRKIYLRSMGHKHKWQFDEVQLIAMLESSGFVQVERMPYHQSRIPGIDQVERSDFLIAEGIKEDHC
jgi:predicted SAM-dependent methyltransferase